MLDRRMPGPQSLSSEKVGLSLLAKHRHLMIEEGSFDGCFDIRVLEIVGQIKAVYHGPDRRSEGCDLHGNHGRIVAGAR